MSGFGTDYSYEMLAKIRQQELMEQAQNERIAKTLRESLTRPLRRTARRERKSR